MSHQADFPLEGKVPALLLLWLPFLPFTQGSRQKPWPDGPPDQTSSPAEDVLPSGEQQELHYASLSFHGMKSWEPLDQEATSTTEYSEIKTS